MGAFSIWHWLIIALGVVIPVVTIALANRDKTLTRIHYVVRTVVANAVVVVLVFVIPSFLQSADQALVLNIAIMIVSLIVFILLTLWSVHRLRDIRWSRWIALIMGIPLGNLILMILLCCWPGRDHSAETAAVFD